MVVRTPAQNTPAENRISMRAVHRQKLRDLQSEAEAVAGTMTRLAGVIREILDNGGTLQTQGQVNFFTGAHARILKDIGIVEYLQSQGVFQKRPSK